ncbi:MAG TPA: hypothetical protein VEC37_04225 [Bacillota bacterium]|nr:hypothetical protein [Bacillota bacterium]
MKKFLIVILLITSSLSLVGNVSARGRRDFDEGRSHPKKVYYSPREKAEAKQTLRETADYLVHAQQAANRGHYSYGLGKAYAHQEEARDLYHARRYERSIAHSLRARDIANFIIRENRERRYRESVRPPRYADRNDEIDNELSIRVVDDKVALKLKINLD